MAKSGRPRSSKNIPKHINLNQLPDNVWYQAQGQGSWMLSYKDDLGRRKNRRIAGNTATILEIYQAAEANKPQITQTFTSLSNEFRQTARFKSLSPLTQKDYDYCHKSIVERDTTAGKIGEIPVSKWTVGLVRRYRDKRAEESKSRAKKELIYINCVFNWAYEYEKVTVNPAAGIKNVSVPPRQHYAADADYEYLLKIARQSGYTYLPYAMELAYLCRMRLSEVLDLTDAAELENGLLIKRRKGSKTTITAWQPRLRQNWDELKRRRDTILQDRHQPLPSDPAHRHLFISERTGDKIHDNSLKTAMTRCKNAAREQAKIDGIAFVNFTFHDLKRKGISETEGDKLQASGHRTASMLNIYDVLPNVVEPTK
ncbi:hypothetical protein KFZ76_11990 [Methylovulum psychrotolerans]|uniref:site-specific integrase n=1 Tax=Methylovulum psychrotolerans TaxID=1704499 RepID=UPI001BFF90D0|nr:hypothetical protein [Methylovulum psychrotolerans]MBT9098428.1 hypothetical protein [Methylovulum psychrotolerans]